MCGSICHMALRDPRSTVPQTFHIRAFKRKIALGREWIRIMNHIAVGEWGAQRRWSWLVGPAMPVLATLCLAAFAVSGYAVWLWALPALIYAVVPLLDFWIGADTRNVLEGEVLRLEQDGFYRALVVAFIPTQYVVIYAGCWLYVHAVTGPWAFVGLVLTVGGLNGLGINTAHELGHKWRAAGRWLAKLALAPAAYGHFSSSTTVGIIATLRPPMTRPAPAWASRSGGSCRVR